MSTIAGVGTRSPLRTTSSLPTQDDGGGSAAETFAIGFAIGGTLLLAGVIIVLVLQTRRGKFKSCLKKTPKDPPLVVTSIQLTSSSKYNNGSTPHGTLQLDEPLPGRFSRISSIANGSLNCFSPGGTLHRSPSSATATSRAPQISPTIPIVPAPLPPPLTTDSLPRDTSRDHLYSDPEACYRMPLDAIMTRDNTAEQSDPHTYADPDATLPRRSTVSGRPVPAPPDGLEYGSVPVAEAQKRAMQDRKARAATMHFATDDSDIDYGPYRTTDLKSSTSLSNVHASTQCEPAYHVQPVAGGSWNKRVSTHSSAVPPPTGRPPLSPSHQRSSSMSLSPRTTTKLSSLRSTLSSVRGPRKSHSLQNLASRVNESKLRGELPPKPPRQRQNLPVVPSALVEGPPKPPRVKHVDPDYIFVKSKSSENAAVDNSQPRRTPLRTCKSVPTRLHAAHKRVSSSSSAADQKQAAVLVNVVPKPLVRMASSEQIELPDSLRRPSAVHLAEPLSDLSESAGCLDLKDALAHAQSRDGKDQAGTISPVLEGDMSDNDEDAAGVELSNFGRMNRRHSTSLPDLSQLMTGPGADRVRDKWQFRMSAVKEGSRDENDPLRQASFEHSLQERQARKLFLHSRMSAVDNELLKPPEEPECEPNYWVLEKQASQESFSSL
ncbi:uncharacterized protein LOC135817528 [Sycon ciliatum]|uniref:uncharacterized protein LOC135817528 n=1 Tax=Sycon ciliatum TaxID=27933 RepID=UPI0031F630C1